MTQVKFGQGGATAKKKKKINSATGYNTMYHNRQSVNVYRFITIKKTYLQTEQQ